ncbi:MAG: SDR family NAD(P)-dependent oxidoreductase, partial [Flavisolibacter sp.]
MITKIALVTGGSRGLGKDMAISIARKGIDVILTYRTNKNEAEETAATIENLGQKAAVLQLDMSSIAAIDPFIESVQKLLKDKWNTNAFDCLVNNAGMGATVP